MPKNERNDYKIGEKIKKTSKNLSMSENFCNFVRYFVNIGIVRDK